jgi:hypothetical protein
MEVFVFLSSCAEETCLDVNSLLVPSGVVVGVCSLTELNQRSLWVRLEDDKFVRKTFEAPFRSVLVGDERIHAARLCKSKSAWSSKLTHLCRVPETAKLGETAREQLIKFLDHIFLRTPSASVSLLVEPDENEGPSPIEVQVPRVGAGRDAAVEEVLQLQAKALEVCVRPKVGNVLYEGRRAVFRVFVSHCFPGMYQCDGGFLVVDERVLPWKAFGLDRATELELWKTAEAALEGINLGLSIDEQLRFASVDLVLELAAGGKCVAWVVNLNAKPSGFANATWFASPSLLWSSADTSLVDLVNGDSDEWHVPLLRDSQEQLDALLVYLEQVPTELEPKLLLKQGRACVVLGDLLFRFRHLQVADWSSVSRVQATRDRLAAAVSDKEMEYLAFLNAF